MRFKSGREEITLERVDAVVALRGPGATPSAAAAPVALRAAAASAHGFRSMPAAPPFAADGLPISVTARRLFAGVGIVFDERHRRHVEAAGLANVRNRNAALPVFRDPSRNTVIATGTVTLRLPEDMSLKQARERLKQDGLTVVEKLGFGDNVYVARVVGQQPLDEAVAWLQDSSEYLFVEPVVLQVLKGRGEVPDPELAMQWHHENAGSAVMKKGCDIRTPAAWKTTRGKGVRIAVIDNGMQIDHPDLKDGIVLAASFATDQATGETTFSLHTPGAPFPDTNHGTFCLGMAGARRNNGVGGAGAAPEAELMAIACAPDQVGTQLTLAKAVAFAADPRTEKSSPYGIKGADVLSCSLGAENGEWTMQTILEEALSHAAMQGVGGRGLPIFWAVSNARVELEKDQVCSHPDVIAVGRSGCRDVRGQCAFGPKLDFLAPGDDVFSTLSESTYGTASGASFACPLAAGVAALVRSQYPGWGRNVVRDQLRDTCDQIGGPTVVYGPDGHNDDYGYGRINADRAVHDTGSNPSPQP